MKTQDYVVYNDGLNAYYVSIRDLPDDTCWINVESVNFTIRAIVYDVVNARYRNRKLALSVLDGLYYTLTARALWPGRRHLLPPEQGLYLPDDYFGEWPEVRDMTYASAN